MALGAEAPGLGVGVEARPGIAGVGAELAGERLELGLGEQRRVVRRVALGRQPPALDRVGEDHARAVGDGVGRPVGVEQRLEVVPAEVADGAQQLVVVELAAEPLEVAPAPPRARQAIAQLGDGGAQQPLVLLVGHLVDPAPQLVAARALEQLGQQAPVLDGQAVPARRLEHGPQAVGGDLGDDPVERLAVEVDDPQHLAEAREVIGSSSASQQAPSSSSASPTSAIWRPPTGTSK